MKLTEIHNSWNRHCLSLSFCGTDSDLSAPLGPWQAMNVCGVFCVTMAIFPGVVVHWLPLVASSFRNSKQLYGNILIGCFQVKDGISEFLFWAFTLGLGDCFLSFQQLPRSVKITNLGIAGIYEESWTGTPPQSASLRNLQVGDVLGRTMTGPLAKRIGPSRLWILVLLHLGSGTVRFVICWVELL